MSYLFTVYFFTSWHVDCFIYREKESSSDEF
jgi:hypothetical protein